MRCERAKRSSRLLGQYLDGHDRKNLPEKRCAVCAGARTAHSNNRCVQLFDLRMWWREGRHEERIIFVIRVVSANCFYRITLKPVTGWSSQALPRQLFGRPGAVFSDSVAWAQSNINHPSKRTQCPKRFWRRVGSDQSRP